MSNKSSGTRVYGPHEGLFHFVPENEWLRNHRRFICVLTHHGRGVLLVSASPGPARGRSPRRAARAPFRLLLTFRPRPASCSRWAHEEGLHPTHCAMGKHASGTSAAPPPAACGGEGGERERGRDEGEGEGERAETTERAAGAGSQGERARRQQIAGATTAGGSRAAAPGGDFFFLRAERRRRTCPEATALRAVH